MSRFPPPLLFFLLPFELFSLASYYYILPLPPFSLHFSLVSPRISSLSTSYSNFFFLSSSRFQSFLFSFFLSIFIPTPGFRPLACPYTLSSLPPSFIPLTFRSNSFRSTRRKRAFEIFLPGWNDCARRNPINALHCSYEPRLIARGNPDQKGYL